MNWGCTVEKHAYVCRIEFFPPKINVNFQLNYIYHILLIYIGHFVLQFEAQSMASFLVNQNFPVWSPSKSCIYEAKFLERKEAQVFTNIGTNFR